MDTVGSSEQIFRKTLLKGTIKIINFTKDGQRYFRVEDDNDPPEREAIDKLLKLITKGPWYDAIVAQKELL